MWKKKEGAVRWDEASFGEESFVVKGEDEAGLVTATEKEWPWDEGG